MLAEEFWVVFSLTLAALCGWSLLVLLISAFCGFTDVDEVHRDELELEIEELEER